VRATEAALVKSIAGVLLMAILIVTEANFRVSENDVLVVDYQTLVRLGICALCGVFGLWMLPCTWRQFATFPGALVALFALWVLGTAPLSLQPTQTWGAVISFGCALLFAAAIGQLLSQRQLLLLSLGAALILLVGSWLVFYFYPALGREPYAESFAGGPPRLAGLTHPNSNGVLAALAAALLIVAGQLRFVSVKWVIAGLLLCGATLLWTHSRSSLAITMLVGGWLLIRSLPGNWRAIAYLAAACAVCGAVLLASSGLLDVDLRSWTSGISRSGESDEVATLTGRTEIWYFVLSQIEAAPVLGHGMATSRFIISQGNCWNGGHAHNLWLHMLLEAGAVGTLLISFSLLWMLLRVWRSPSGLPTAVLTIVLLDSMVSVPILSPVPGALTVLWLICLLRRSDDETQDSVRENAGLSSAPGVAAL
jgi:O-antigen ligase